MMKRNQAQSSRITQVAAAVVVALATSTFSGCTSDSRDLGAPPAPLNCDLVQEGQSLVSFGEMQGLTMALTVRHQAFGPGNPGQAFWNNVGITQVAGGNLISFELNGPDVRIRIGVANAANASGTFVLQGTLDGSDRSCPVTRTFTFVVTDGVVQIG
jgi:hypothetical protein